MFPAQPHLFSENLREPGQPLAPEKAWNLSLASQGHTWLWSLQHDPRGTRDLLEARLRQIKRRVLKKPQGPFLLHRLCQVFCKPLPGYQAATPFIGRNGLLGFVSHAAKDQCLVSQFCWLGSLCPVSISLTSNLPRLLLS